MSRPLRHCRRQPESTGQRLRRHVQAPRSTTEGRGGQTPRVGTTRCSLSQPMVASGTEGIDTGLGACTHSLRTTAGLPWAVESLLCWRCLAAAAVLGRGGAPGASARPKNSAIMHSAGRQATLRAPMTQSTGVRLLRGRQEFRIRTGTGMADNAGRPAKGCRGACVPAWTAGTSS